MQHQAELDKIMNRNEVSLNVMDIWVEFMDAVNLLGVYERLSVWSQRRCMK